MFALGGLIIAEDSDLGWVLARVIPEFKEVQILCIFGSIENADTFVDALIAWREKRRSAEIPKPFKDFLDELGEKKQND